MLYEFNHGSVTTNAQFDHLVKIRQQAELVLLTKVNDALGANNITFTNISIDANYGMIALKSLLLSVQ